MLKIFENFTIAIYYNLKHHGVNWKLGSHSIIRKSVDCGCRTKVQIAIKYSILGILQNFKLE